MTLDVQPQSDAPDATPRLVAVIDIGSTSLRMQIAEIKHDRSVRRIESFSQAVSLGEDSFSKRAINHDTIEDCVLVLSSYRDQLNEYGIKDKADIRVVATSGLNEASNRLAFQDRIFIATGFDIEPFDEAELHRVTYLGVLPFILDQPEKFSAQTLVLEVGGGTSEVMLLKGMDVSLARTFPMGALRLRKMLEAYDAPLVQSRSLMESRIEQTIDQFIEDGDHPKPDGIIAMGSDVRFAARAISQVTVGSELVEISTKKLLAFTESILALTPATIAAKYHMSLPDAQSLGPALLTQTMFATKLGIRRFHVVHNNLRDGLVMEMAQGRRWSSAIQAQVVRSALQLGRKYHFDEAHAVRVAKLATTLFDQLQAVHELPPRFRITLEMSALLHDIGRYISSRSRHKHSMYLIQNAEMFGVSSSELQLIAQLCRYHRGANPQPRHLSYSRLERDHRIVVAKLAALLRVAISLDQPRGQKIEKLQTRLLGNTLTIEVADVADLTVERLELRQNGRLFESIFGKHVVLSTAGETA